jgi:aspartyl-tRNA(Asn)/glutamyl-tRNA(Gln) amidotransferase subunit A
MIHAGLPPGGEGPGALARLSAVEMMEGYRNGRFTPSEVVEDVIAALERTQRSCNVMVTAAFEGARAEAARQTEAWRAGRAVGTLAGVPISVKDLIYVAGVPAMGGAPTSRGFVPAADAVVVRRLREAGAIVTCKTTTCESGYKLTADSPVSGITRNPWHLARTSGGSSGGAAAAVAAGCGPLALGTDGVGSIRVPASFCGVVGMKPTFGLVPRAPGFFPPSWASLAHTGPIGRNVRDVSLLLEVIAGYDILDAASLPMQARAFDVAAGRLEGVRIAVTPDWGFAAVDPDVRRAYGESLDVLADLGAELIQVDPGLDPDMLDNIAKPIAYTEQAGAIAGRSEEDLALSEPDYRRVIDAGRAYRGTEYVAAMHRRAQLRGQFVRLFERADLLVTPTVATTAFEAGTLGVDRIDGRATDRHLGWSPFSWPINLAGLPAITLPCGFDTHGLPIGMQIVGPWLAEDRILRAAAAFESVPQGWQGRRPSFRAT